MYNILTCISITPHHHLYTFINSIRKKNLPYLSPLTVSSLTGAKSINHTMLQARLQYPISIDHLSNAQAFSFSNSSRPHFAHTGASNTSILSTPHYGALSLFSTSSSLILPDPNPRAYGHPRSLNQSMTAMDPSPRCHSPRLSSSTAIVDLTTCHR